MNGKPTKDVNKQPLTPALSPYEGERVNGSLVLEHTKNLDFRSWEVVLRTDLQFRAHSDMLIGFWFGIFAAML